MGYKLIPADSSQLRQQVIELLLQNNLPVNDLDETKQLFALMDNEDQVVGCGGLEFFGDLAFLRSVCVRKELQGKGLGKEINWKLEQIAMQSGARAVYLLTTTAKNFFEKEGYGLVDRNDVPLTIKETSEFAGVCPSTAIVMKKILRPA